MTCKMVGHTAPADHSIDTAAEKGDGDGVGGGGGDVGRGGGDVGEGRGDGGEADQQEAQTSARRWFAVIV